MCRVEDADPWDFFHQEIRRAAKEHRCCECRRLIKVGETHEYSTGVLDRQWVSYRMCEHCLALGGWLVAVCGGFMFTQLLEELVEHWEEGYASVPFGRLIVSMKRKWHDGADPVPVRQVVRDLAAEMEQAMEARIRA